MRNWVDVHYEKAGETMGWAERNCPSYVTVDVSTVKTTLLCRFYFSGKGEEQDRVIFQLRWA